MPTSSPPLPRAQSPRRRRVGIALATLAPPLAALVAWRDLPNGWLFNDDYQILYEFANGTIARALFAPAFGHLDTTRNGVMGILFAAVGPRVAAFFIAGLIVHALNAILVFRLATRLTGEFALTSALAVMWAISPLHHGTLEWIAAHGQVWITALVFVMLNRLAALEERDGRLSGGEGVLWGIALLLINTCYTGIGLALPIAVVVIAGRRASRASLAAMGGALAIFAAAYTLLNAAYPPAPAALGHALQPTLAYIFEHRSAVVVAGFHLVMAPTSALVLGPLFRAATYPAWSDWIAAGTGLVLVLAGFCASGRRRWLGGLLILGLSSYLLIATLRIVLSPDRPLMLALTPRYHYFAQAILAVALAIALASVRAAASRLLVNATIGWAAVLFATLAVRPLAVDRRVPGRAETERALAEIRTAIAEAPRGSTVYIPNRRFQPMEFLALFQGPWKFPGLAGIFVIFFPGDSVDGHPVRFVADAPEELSAHVGGGRIATLLVPRTPGAAPAPEGSSSRDFAQARCDRANRDRLVDANHPPP